MGRLPEARSVLRADTPPWQAGMDVEFFCLEWFIAIFAKTLPTATLLRVWDSVFLEVARVHPLLFAACR